MPKVSFYAKGRRVFRHPLRDGRAVTMGFPVLELEEFIEDADGLAEKLAELLTREQFGEAPDGQAKE